MRSVPVLKRVPLVLAIIGMALSGGCRVLDIDMTSTPEAVRRGNPVNFDIKITNRSQCPLKPTVGAALVAFIPLSDFANLFGEIPPDAPPELLEFEKEIQMFFDELCTGGDPPFPGFPDSMALATSCNRGDGEIVCEMSGAAPARQGDGDGMTFATLGDRLECAVDGALMSCRLRIPLPSGATIAAGTTAAAVKQMRCFTAGDFGLPEFGEAENFGVCFVGDPTMGLEVLGPGQMATGTVTLLARGSGVVRNLVFGISDESDDLGVCKAGSSAAGEPCDFGDSTECDGTGTCGAGICLDGTNAGNGCDAAADCPKPPGTGTCQLCANFPGSNSTISLDCTTTHVGVEPAPATSLWTTAVLAGLLLAMGVQWVRRRSEDRGR